MWDYDSMLGKAQLYFTRAREHPDAEDDAFAVWLLLGLEFLLRAPLARINPMLLADPTGDSLMHAAGFPNPKPDAKEPKSIQVFTAIQRLGQVVKDFTPQRQADALILCALRNRELHTGEPALSIDQAVWLPRFTRVVEVICAHLALDPVDLLGEEIVRQGRALIDEEDKKLKHEIAERIKARHELFAQLRPEEIEARRSRLLPDLSEALLDPDLEDDPDLRGVPIDRTMWPARPGEVDCPACQTRVSMRDEAVRTTNERIEDDGISSDVIYVAKGLSCAVCGLELTSTAEISCAGLPQQYIRRVFETVEERYMTHYVADDYGND